MKHQQNSFNELRVSFILMCLSSALHHIHSRGIIHRDIKPENILFNERGYPLLTDFGVAFIHPLHQSIPLLSIETTFNYETTTDQNNPFNLCCCTMSSGTRQYLAPEIFTSTHLHGPLVDYWSLGVTVYELIYGRRPYLKHCPSNFIAFAEKKYLLSDDGDDLPMTFSTKQHQAPPLSVPPSVTTSSPIINQQHETPEENLLLSASIVTIDCSEPAFSKIANGGNFSPCSIAQPMSPCRVSDYNPSTPPPATPSNSYQTTSSTATTLPTFLQSRVPQSSLLHGDVSSSCRKVISKLLDVRPHCRHTYISLLQDRWFKELKLNWNEVEKCQINPPFRPNLKEVSLDICSKYMLLSTEDEDPNIIKPSLDNFTTNLLQSTLSRYRYISPEFIQYVPQEYLQKIISPTTTITTTTIKNQKVELTTTIESKSGGEVVT